MSELMVIGDPDFNIGFRLSGIRNIVDVTDETELPKIVEEALQKKGIVVIKYDLYKSLPIQLKLRIEESIEPTFVKVGGEGGVEEIKEKIRKAIGVDLWKE
ncbi:Archaeal/vacuolar-type H+-ATPase subunit F [Archaeoglobus sulfaticallidus PM70-1]|uniref:A-type ATP synthase subunit F n=1 Tax=Archaeoglobus sulfaticallidus PM70-1 TaxID=387631 RepID=N0BIK6_9EURY|nr:V-type ATP synthase subunit F [Archaeoglobus sulfaticallidus]AGK62147.1 Archaeal/vacuolar-type H+-ATPase subunit F [Archaeoglobus sulfaticallidus PM70-1]